MPDDNLHSDLNNQDGSGRGDQTENLDNAPAGDRPAWMDQNPDDLKDNEVLARRPTIEALSRDFLDLHGKSESSIQHLGENPTDEERNAFYSALGRPETPEGYKFEAFKMPEDIPYDDALDKWHRQTAHELGLNQDQASGYYDRWNTRMKAAYEEVQGKVGQRRTQAMDALKALPEWGSKTPVNLDTGKRALDTLMGEMGDRGPLLRAFLDESGLGDHPLMVELGWRIGRKLMPDKIVTGGAASGDKKSDAEVLYG